MWTLIEGVDAVGKSTVIKSIINSWEGSIKALHDPGVHEDHEVCQELRKIVKYKQLDADAETLLFMACRKELVAEIKRLNDQNIDVVVDRYRASTIIYQGIMKNRMELITRMEQACNFPVPDISFYLFAPFEVLTERLIKRNGNIDKFKSNEDFRKRVWYAYDEFIEKEIEKSPYTYRIDASGTETEVFEMVFSKIQQYKAIKREKKWQHLKK